ncbi:MAG: LysR substrate-binding domain-containing protein [Sphingobium sp.]
MTETDNARIVQLVSRGEADIGVFAMAHELDLSGVDVTSYRRDRLVVVVPRNHPLSVERKVRFRDIRMEEVVALDALKGAFSAAAKRLGHDFTPHLSVRSAGVALSLVQAELGVTILPECQVSRDMIDTLATIELVEPWAVRSVHIATGKGRPLSPAADALMRQLLQRPQDE